MNCNQEKAVSTLQDALDKRNMAVQEFLKRILIGAVSLFGILLSLRRTDTGIAGIEWTFAISILLLSLGILSGCVSLYGEVSLRVRAVRAEAQRVLNDHTKSMRPVSVNPLRIFSICTVASYISLGLSVLGLGVSFFLGSVLR
ncbi:hypothetical protein [Millionella massiliensis]|uniref:hypothetical protein n=1 Tax=Millionella massiliensis TaxID=1871023 RepID=UPI0024B7D774|nr:hypothetical protein [Millionella massiliensis]